MKKLLFIGALLVAGATSFGAVKGDFTGEATGASANANLRLSSRGSVVDTQKVPVLIVTPTVNAGADGESLSFDFGSLIIGEPQTMEGKFTAEIWYKDAKLPFGDAEISTVLSLTDGADKTQTPPQEGDYSITGIKLKDTSSGSDLGTLAYTLSGTQTNNFTYTGTINATAKASKIGSFNDKSAVVTVSVSGFSYTPQP